MTENRMPASMDLDTNLGERWFALQVRTRWEASTAVLLGGKGYQVFLPTYKTKKRRSGRLREVNAPLFPGYVFCRFEAQKRLPVLVTPGVMAVVGRGRVPLAVDDNEIDGIRAAVTSGFRAEPWPFLEVGQHVRIDSDPLRGFQGILLSFKGNFRIVLSVSLLRRSVAVEVDRCSVTPLTTSRPPNLGGVTVGALLQEGVA